MKYSVVNTPVAKADLRRIHDMLKERFGIKSAIRFKAGFGKIVEALGNTPRMYEAVPEIPSVHKCTALSPTLLLYQMSV